MTKRVLIIHPEGNTFNNPTLGALVNTLLENGVKLSIRCDKSKAHKPVKDGLTWIVSGRFFRRLKNLFLNRLCLLWPVKLLVHAHSLINKTGLDCDFIIGVDREGLVEAAILSAKLKKPFCFFSFEIMFQEETSKRFKDIERICSKSISLYVVQDETRAHHLSRQNGLEGKKCILWPLASSGAPESAEFRLRDRLGIPSDKKVAISIGSLTKWSMAEEICRSAAQWNEEWVLILHDRYGQIPRFLEHPDLKHLIGKKIYLSKFSSESVDQMANILAGIDVGLAFYKPDYNSRYTGLNLQYIGRASGKIATYLRYGVPVAMNDIGEMAKDCHKFGFGLVLEDPTALPNEFEKLDKAALSEKAAKYFNAHLDNARFATDFLNLLNNSFLISCRG